MAENKVCSMLMGRKDLNKSKISSFERSDVMSDLTSDSMSDVRSDVGSDVGVLE